MAGVLCGGRIRRFCLFLTHAAVEVNYFFSEAPLLTRAALFLGQRPILTNKKCKPTNNAMGKVFKERRVTTTSIM